MGADSGDTHAAKSSISGALSQVADAMSCRNLSLWPLPLLDPLRYATLYALMRARAAPTFRDEPRMCTDDYPRIWGETTMSDERAESATAGVNGAVEAGAPPELDRGQLILALAGVLLCILVAALDQTIVGTALPRIVAELNGFDRYS